MSANPEPSRYRIVVRGRMGDHLANAFDELELESHDGVSSLTGTFIDQAQLHGLLERLGDVGIQLISVNPID